MRIIRPNEQAGKRADSRPNRPAWFTEWLRNQGKWVLLECGCIMDVNLPSCVDLLTGGKIYISCDTMGHGFSLVKKTLKFRDVMKLRYGIEIQPVPMDPLF